MHDASDLDNVDPTGKTVWAKDENGVYECNYVQNSASSGGRWEITARSEGGAVMFETTYDPPEKKPGGKSESIDAGDVASGDIKGSGAQVGQDSGSNSADQNSSSSSESEPGLQKQTMNLEFAGSITTKDYLEYMDQGVPVYIGPNEKVTMFGQTGYIGGERELQIGMIKYTYSHEGWLNHFQRVHYEGVDPISAWVIPGAGPLKVTSMVKSTPSLLKLARQTFKGKPALRAEVNKLIGEMRKGNLQTGRGVKPVFGNIHELRGYGQGRVYFRNVEGGFEILGYSHKANQTQVINALKKAYGK